MKSVIFIILFIPFIPFAQGIRLDEPSFKKHLTDSYKRICNENCFFSLDYPESYKGNFQKSDSLRNGYNDSLNKLVMLNYQFNKENYENYVLVRNKEQIIGSLYTESLKDRKKWTPMSSLSLFILSRKDISNSCTLFFSFEPFQSGDEVIYYLRTVSEVDTNGKVQKFVIINDEAVGDLYLQSDKKIYRNYKCNLSIDLFNYDNLMNFSFEGLNTNFVKNVEMLLEPEFSPEKGVMPFMNIAH